MKKNKSYSHGRIRIAEAREKSRAKARYSHALKIAMLSLAHKPLPGPKGVIFAPGLIAFNLTQELIKKGHSVDLYAPQESKKQKANLIHHNLTSVFKNYYKKGGVTSPDYIRQMNQIDLLNTSLAIQKANQGEYDIIHSHDYRQAMYFAPFSKIPIIFTTHVVIPKNQMSPFEQARMEKLKKFNHFVSISKKQRKLLAQSNFNFIGHVPHGIDISKFPFNPSPKNYLLYSGRITNNKGAHTAINTAKKTDSNLLLAGSLDPNPIDQKYFANKIKPHLSKKIKHLGFVSPQKIIKLYSDAKTLLFPSEVEESFGLSIIEAMACGTPVVSFDKGIAKEAIINNQTGFLVKNTNEMIAAVKKIYSLPPKEYLRMRQNCRRHIEKNFTLEKMATGYEKIYYQLAKK